MPQQIIMDKESIMMAREFWWHLREHMVCQSPMIAYHQQANRLVEQIMQTLRTMVRKQFLNQEGQDK